MSSTITVPFDVGNTVWFISDINMGIIKRSTDPDLLNMVSYCPFQGVITSSTVEITENGPSIHYQFVFNDKKTKLSVPDSKVFATLPEALTAIGELLDPEIV